MKNYKYYWTCLLLVLLTLSLQSCLGSGSDSNQFTKKNGAQVGISDQAVFKGEIYFTLNRNLYVLDGTRTLHQLTKGMDVRNPAISPDGKRIAFVIRYKDYSNLAYMPSSGGKPTILENGNGQYLPDGDTPKSTHHWFAQPAWAADSQHLLFLSDLEKDKWNIGINAFLLDLQIFSISIHSPTNIQDVAYATYGDGGLHDPAYRPGHANQIIYTNYQYNAQLQQQVQLYMEDPTLIANDTTGKYHPGTAGAGGTEYDPAVPITPDNTNVTNMEPSFAPDGNTILYARTDDATHMSLYTMSVPENITDDPNNPAIEKKALAPYNHSSLILTQQFLSQPIWSPDGKQIAYVGYSNNTFNIWLATLVKNPKTGAYTLKANSLVQLTDAQGHLDADSRPCWGRIAI